MFIEMIHTDPDKTMITQTLIPRSVLHWLYLD